ncbi:TAF-domain-containing protein [Hypoxylon trugodes]|uniref:TAF-domain-containing protein n=1 Tax=Hypoxylon trugodes TaxID=326681 RepID=UPI002197C87E|nr:TAF-domain-containing protein [Hypoxylon trugodes]KAI1391619.1 TAF-domain-containing protein [Hypoxylon trugodes]
MAAVKDNRTSTDDAAVRAELKLLWNQDTVRDVAESVGIQKMDDEVLRKVAQESEHRLGQIIVGALRFMRAAGRTSLMVQDIQQAMRVLNVEPMFGYVSDRPLRYGEASLGSQALYYVEDEEMDFDKMINLPLPKIPRDMYWSRHWLALDGVLTYCPENVTPAEGRVHDSVARGPGANPALAALSGQDNPAFKPAVKHIISKELALYFEKVQAAVMDENGDVEVQRLREAALESVRTEPSIHQLAPYFVNFIADEVTHHLDNTFILRRALELTEALVSNSYVFLGSYASSLAAPVLTCLLGRKIGGEDGILALEEQYQLREFAASLLGLLARKFSAHNRLFRPKLVRTCLKDMLNPSNPPSVWYGAISGITKAGNPDVIKVLFMRNLKEFEKGMLGPMSQKVDATSRAEYGLVVGAIMGALTSLVEDTGADSDEMDGVSSEGQINEIKAFVGNIIGERVANLGRPKLNEAILDGKNYV